jgi:transcriptional regulator with XRE-family HTH domain
MLAENFATNLAHGRKRKKLTQEKVASLMNVSVSYVSMLERGQRTPPLETVELAAAALGVEPLALLRAR